MTYVKYITIICLLVNFLSCSTDNSNIIENTDNFMEPRVLVIGRLQSTLDILVEEWERYGRNVIASNSKDKIKEIIKNDSIDFVAIGGGLPDDERDQMVDYISTIDANISAHPIPRTEEAMGPYNFIPFVNNLAIMFKVRKAMEE
tara:strand:- start:677 stop:1111 length:435 start_codon:yes stop_codon:yes gene_type:complete